ncbi:hypothetical protein [Pricia sp.]|uniref:hypothetical protein n=1 Tax=Pricia sp. TaxID=2268138 RepID=UPI0035930846
MKKSTSLLVLFAFIVVLGGCKKDNATEGSEILQSKVYQLEAMGGSNVSGTATFTEDIEGKTTILLELEGSTTDEHPAFIRYNSASIGGDVAITLKKCTCSVGETVVSKLDNGEPIDYDGLLRLDGHISIHQSPKNLETIVSTANIGVNE